MKKKPLFFLYILLAIIVLGALLGIVKGSLEIPGLLQDTSRLWKKMVIPLIRLTIFVSLGIFAAQIIEGMGWSNRMAVMARPFMGWGHLSNEMGAVFTTAFISGTTSLSMLMSFYQDGKLDRRQVILSVLLNTFPSFFLHLPTTFFIIIPLVGAAGVLYLCITFGAALLRLSVVILCTRFVLPQAALPTGERPPVQRAERALLQRTWKRFKFRIGRILLIVIPVFFIIAVISDMGFFVWLKGILVRSVTGNWIPLEAISIVIFSLVAEFTSGYAAAGAMLKAGTLNVAQTVLALLLGNIIAAPVRALRHQLPYYMGIFSPGMGVGLMAASQCFRIVSLFAAGALFILIVRMGG